MESEKIECKCTDKQRGIVFNGVDGSVRCCVCAKIIMRFVDLKLAKLIGLWHTIPDQLRNEIRDNLG